MVVFYQRLGHGHRRKGRIRRKGRGARPQNLKMRPMVGTRKKPGLALIKEPSEFIPDRMFVPIKWTSGFSNPTPGYNFPGVYQLAPLYTICGDGSDIGKPNSDATTTEAGLNTNPYHMFDTLAKFYNNVRVYSSSIKIDIQPGIEHLTTENANTAVVVYPVSFNQAKVTTGAAALSYEAATQQPFARSLVYDLLKTGNKPLYNKMLMRKFFGISKAQLQADPNFYLGTTANNGPSPPQLQQLAWIIGIYDVSGAISTAAPLPGQTYVGTVEIVTNVEFFGRRNDYTTSD